MSIIQIQHLYKTFGTGENAVHALEDISLDIQKGEIFRNYRSLRRRQEHPGAVHEPAGASHLRHRDRGREGYDGP